MGGEEVVPGHSARKKNHAACTVGWSPKPHCLFIHESWVCGLVPWPHTISVSFHTHLGNQRIILTAVYLHCKFTGWFVTPPSTHTHVHIFIHSLCQGCETDSQTLPKINIQNFILYPQVSAVWQTTGPWVKYNTGTEMVSIFMQKCAMRVFLGGNTAHIPGSCYQKDVQNNQSSH